MAELAAQSGVPREDRGFPTAIARTQALAQERVERAKLFGFADTLSVRWICGDQSARRLRGGKIRELAALEHDLTCEAGARGIGFCVADRDGVAVEAANASRRQQVRLAARFGVRAEFAPGRPVVLLPALEGEPLAEKPRCDIGGNERRLDRKRAGATHRIDEATAGRRDRRPAGANENRGCKVLLERRRALSSPIATPVQAVARQVDRDRDGATRRVHIDAEPWRIAVDGGPRPRPLAKLVDDRVLDSLRAELCMRHAGNAPGEVDGECAVDVHVRAPVDLADSCVERAGVCNGKSRDLPEHPKAQARLEAGTVCARQLRFAGDSAQHFARAFDAESGQLRGEQVGRAGRRRHEEQRADHDPPGFSSSAPRTGRSRNPVRIR